MDLDSAKKLPEMVEYCRRTMNRHEAVDGVCPLCTRLGVGSNQEPVVAPCGEYSLAAATMRRICERVGLAPE